jgi:N-acetylglucosaminyltransferase
VLCDSDTLWPPDLLGHLVAPFADHSIGGVATRVSVIDAGGNVWRLAAESILDAKFRTAFRALATAGAVSLLSGRTAAYRREALLPVLPALLDETFLGRRCRSGDDGRLTWLVLNQGYRTTFQSTARVWTMMPATLAGFARQRVRHGRNDYRRYVTALRSGWLRRQPAVTRATLVQKLLEPFALALGCAMLVLALRGRDAESVVAWNVWLARGRGQIVRAELGRGPAALLRLIALAAVVVFVAAVIKWWAFASMARQGWGTRRADADVPDGQSSTTLRCAVQIPLTPDGGAP